MAAEYKMERNPPKGDAAAQPPLHPRIVSKGTVGLKELMQFSNDRSSISSADIQGAMQILSEFITEHLRDGYGVRLEGIGSFSVTLASRPVMEAKELRSESVRFKNVKFRCSPVLKQSLKAMPVRKHAGGPGDSFDPAERRSRLMSYLDRKGYITSTQYAVLNHCSKYCAQKELKQCVAEGELKVLGRRSSTLYQKKDG